MPAGASWARANVAAKAAWLLPLAGLAVVGFAEKGRALLPVSDTTLIVLAGSMAALGLVASLAALVASAAGVPMRPRERGLDMRPPERGLDPALRRQIV